MPSGVVAASSGLAPSATCAAWRATSSRLPRCSARAPVQRCSSACVSNGNASHQHRMRHRQRASASKTILPPSGCRSDAEEGVRPVVASRRQGRNRCASCRCGEWVPNEQLASAPKAMVWLGFVAKTFLYKGSGWVGRAERRSGLRRSGKVCRESEIKCSRTTKMSRNKCFRLEGRSCRVLQECRGGA